MTEPNTPSDDRPTRPPPEEPPSRRGPMIALLLLVGLIVAGWFLSDILRAAARVQDCVMAGRRNCVIFH